MLMLYELTQADTTGNALLLHLDLVHQKISKEETRDKVEPSSNSLRSGGRLTR